MEENLIISKILQNNFPIDRILSVYEVFKTSYGENFVDLQAQELFTLRNLLTEGTVQNFASYYGFYYEFIDEELGNVLIKNCSEYQLSKILNERILGILMERISNVYIMVHFPLIRVTNEYDKYIDIYDVYVKVPLDLNGTLLSKFSIIRSTYTYEQLYSRYIHSHCPSLNHSNLTAYSEPCLGSGPIRNTISSLLGSYDEYLWALFCVELKQYLEIESVSGGPYLYLEKVYNNVIESVSEYTVENTTAYYPFSNTIVDFCNYLILKKGIRFDYINNTIQIAMPISEYILYISNTFIEWWNMRVRENPTSELNPQLQDLLSLGVLRKAFIKNNTVQYIIERQYDLSSLSELANQYVCNFKGSRITLKIRDIVSEEDNSLLLLNHQLALYILNNMLKTLNYLYGNPNSNSADTINKKYRIF